MKLIPEYNSIKELYYSVGSYDKRTMNSINKGRVYKSKGGIVFTSKEKAKNWINSLNLSDKDKKSFKLLKLLITNKEEEILDTGKELKLKRNVKILNSI